MIKPAKNRVEHKTGGQVKVADAPDQVFKKACELAEIPATRRQQVKWRKGRGKALAQKFEAIKALSNA